MSEKYTPRLQSFTIDNLPNLDEVVLGSLELLSNATVPTVDISKFNHPLVVGSGAAEIAGRVAFSKVDAVFASESNVEEKLRDIKTIDEVILISASGAKNAPIIAQMALQYGKHVTLVTNTLNSPAYQLLGADNCAEYVFPKNREPYTYNTSTYMGMIQSTVSENPAGVLEFIENTVSKIDFSKMAQYDKFFLIVPTHLSAIMPMYNCKFIELFGRNVAYDIETLEYATRHATTVNPAKELFISFGQPDENWGLPEDRLFVPLPENANYVAMMAVGYYTIGQIQKLLPPYFKNNIANYINKVSEITGEKYSAIIEGNQG